MSLRRGPGGVASAIAVAGLLLSLAPSVAHAAKFQTGFADTLFSSPDPLTRATWLDRARSARSGVVRIDVSWNAVAPAVEPPDPTDPAAYDWGALPAAAADAKARGLKVLLTVSNAPEWAEAPGRPFGAPSGTWKPDPEKFGQFARALAARFSSSVRRYQAWNEPNLYTFLNPQYEGKNLVAATNYRRMLNAFYDGINAVQPSAFVVTAGTAPYGGPPGGNRTRPLAFLRKFLCLRGRGKLKPVRCGGDKPKFDALAHHPINTSGGPTRSAFHPDDASTPDVHNVVRTLRKAERTNRVRGRHQVWLTEFWWETKPPDQCTGIPLRRHKRWIMQALRSFKRQGARVAINFQIRDTPYDPAACGRATFQSGAFFADGSRKPAFRAFRKFARKFARR